MKIILFRKLNRWKKKLTKNADENKEIAAKIKNKISDLKDKIREMSKTEKKVWMRH